MRPRHCCHPGACDTAAAQAHFFSFISQFRNELTQTHGHHHTSIPQCRHWWLVTKPVQTAARRERYCQPKNCDCHLFKYLLRRRLPEGHRKQHQKACTQRAAEFMDELLYSQGHERPEGDFCLPAARKGGEGERGKRENQDSRLFRS